MDSFIYDGKSESLEKALSVYSQGGKVLCPECGNELLIIIDKSARAKHKISPGIYCFTDFKHMYKVLILSEPFEEFNRLFKLDQ